MVKKIEGQDDVVFEYPPSRRTITINWRDIYSDEVTDHLFQKSYFIQLPYLFILQHNRFGSMKQYLSFGKEPFGKDVDFYFPALPNVYNEDGFLVCLGNGSFWQTAYYEFTNYITLNCGHRYKINESFSGVTQHLSYTAFRWRGSLLAHQYFGGFTEWQNLNLQEVLDRMIWKPEQSIFNKFIMDEMK